MDDISTATLDEALVKKALSYGKKTTEVKPELIHDGEWLLIGFKREANFVTSRYQVYYYTTTYVKYFIKKVLKTGLKRYKMQLCRFRAPWKLVSKIGFTDDGLLKVKRDHQMVN